MQLKIYSIRDAKGNMFKELFLKRMQGEAERDFTQLANDPKTNIFLYPEDFDLYYMGELDDVSGKIKALDTPQHIVKAVTVKNVPSQSDSKVKELKEMRVN